MPTSIEPPEDNHPNLARFPFKPGILQYLGHCQHGNLAEVVLNGVFFVEKPLFDMFSDVFYRTRAQLRERRYFVCPARQVASRQNPIINNRTGSQFNCGTSNERIL